MVNEGEIYHSNSFALDIHDALPQIIAEMTDCLFPRTEGKAIPQTEDRYFQKVEAEKFIISEERVEIEIEEKEEGKQIQSGFYAD